MILNPLPVMERLTAFSAFDEYETLSDQLADHILDRGDVIPDQLSSELIAFVVDMDEAVTRLLAQAIDRIALSESRNAVSGAENAPNRPSVALPSTITADRLKYAG